MIIDMKSSLTESQTINGGPEAAALVKTELRLPEPPGAADVVGHRHGDEDDEGKESCGDGQLC